MRTRLLLAIALILLPAAATAEVGTKLLASGFDEPIWAESPSGLPESLWVVEKPGTIQILDLASGQRTRFLDIKERITVRMNEQGLLGMAFSKDYLSSGRFYVYYTNTKGDSEIVRFQAHGDNKKQCNPSSGELLLTIPQNARNHNGGWLGFGPDGHLYISVGDGGKGFDPEDHGQDLSTHLGKILRIDVSGDSGYSIPTDNPFIDTPEALPEIFAYGLRNPWRCSWDSVTSNFYIADVGQTKHEEINCTSHDDSRGANFGWRLREGFAQTPRKNIGGDKPAKAIEPVYTYEHASGDFNGVSVTGGYVYRGAIKSLQGQYFFADYANPRIWSFQVIDGKAENLQDWTDRLKPSQGKLNRIASFGQTDDGELLIISLGGDLFKIVDEP